MNGALQRTAKAALQLRQMSSVKHNLSAQKVFGPVAQNIKENQAFFQDPLNDKDMYIKKGGPDVLLYGFTCLLAAVGLGMMGKRVYERGLY